MSDLTWRIKFYCPVPLCPWHSAPCHPQQTEREGRAFETHYVSSHMPRPGIEQILPDPIPVQE